MQNQAMQKTFANTHGLICKYDKDHYPGIQIIKMTSEPKANKKEMRSLNVGIFRSGTMVIQGTLRGFAAEQVQE